MCEAGANSNGNEAQIVPISLSTAKLQKAMLEANITHPEALGDADIAFMVEIAPLDLITVSIQLSAHDDPDVAVQSTMIVGYAPASLCLCRPPDIMRLPAQRAPGRSQMAACPASACPPLVMSSRHAP